MTLLEGRDLSRKGAVTAMAAVVALQLAVCALFALAKQGMFQDEAFSLVLANGSFTGSVPEDGVLYHGGEPWAGWASVGSFLGVDPAQVFQNQSDDVHPPLYYLFLNLAYSLFPGSTSLVVGCALNAVFLCGSAPLLYLLGREAGAPRWACALLCLAWAVNAGMANCLLLVRMYALLTAVFLGAALVVARLLSAPRATLPQCAALLAVSFLGLFTQYFFAIFAAGLYGAAAVVLLKRRRLRCLAKCAACAVAGFALAVAAFPSCIDHVFFGYRGTEALEQAASNEGFLAALAQDVRLLDAGVLGGLLAPLLAAVAVLAVVCALRAREEGADRGRGSLAGLGAEAVRSEAAPAPSGPRWAVMGVLAFSAAFYVLAVARVAPYASIRYLLAVQPVLLAAVMLPLMTLALQALRGRAAACACALLAVAVAVTALGYGYGVKYLDQQNDDVVAADRENGAMLVAYQGATLLQALLPDAQASGDSAYFSTLEAFRAFDFSQTPDFSLYVQPGMDPQPWLDAASKLPGATVRHVGSTIDGYEVYDVHTDA